MQAQRIRVLFSYGRLFIASWIFMGGVAMQFLPTAATTARDARWRERQLQKLPAEQHAQWIEERDKEDGQAQAYLRLAGVILGGLGLAAALRETALLIGRYSR